MELPDWTGQVLLAGGGGAAVTFALFKFLGQNWIKHQLAKNLEQAKSEISFHAAKRLRLQDKEYEIFPELWTRLSDAKTSLSACLLEFRTFPDFGKMNDDEFSRWLESQDFEKDEKKVLTEADNKFNVLDKILDFRNLKKAESDYLVFQDYFQKNRIFLSPELREKFDEIQGFLRKVWASKKTDFSYASQHGNADHFMKALDTYDENVQPLITELETIIQRKLFPEAAED